MLFHFYFINTKITVSQLENCIRTNDLVMITSPTCKNCAKAKSILAQNNVVYKNVDIKEEPEMFSYVSKKEHINYVPVLYYKGKFLNNFALLKNYIPLNEDIQKENPQVAQAG